MKICLVCEGVSETTQEHCATCGRPLLDTRAVHFPLRRGEEDAANPLLGSLVDSKYRVQSVLGKGGMGTVFRAIHEVSLVPVALKILNPRFSHRREYREHFLAEAQKAGRVTHEHTARIMDVGEAEDGTVYIAMEIVNGVTLHECIHSEVPLVPVQVVDILQQICDALAAAHQAGLVHRDLSTRNVMVVSRQGKPFIKILDFGIAKGMPMLQSEAGPSAAAAPVGFASPPYSAPEHLERKNVDARADLYSLGVIGYEAMTGRFPVDGNSGHELAEATLQGAVIPLEPRPGTPMPLVRLIGRLLAKDPGQRPSSANEVLAELYRIRQRGSPLVRSLAVASMVIALFLLTVAFAVPQERVCVIQSGSIDVTAPGVAAKLQVIQSSVIQHLRFDYAGFDARDILVEIKQGDGPPRPLSLLPEAADGVVDLAPTPDKLEYVCDELRKASRDGDVDLIFRWRARPPFGVARLRIDDEAPTIDFEPSELLRENKILSSHPGCYLDLKVQDQSGPVSVTLSGFYLSGDPQDSRRMGEPIRLPPVAAKIRPVAILGNLHRGPRPSGPVGLRVAATDAAGNVHRTGVLRFQQMDFAVPRIEFRGPLNAVHDELFADLALPVDETEDDLIVHIKGPRDLSRSLSPMRRGRRELWIRLPKPADSGFVNGTYQIELEDPAGNRSPEPFPVEIVFRSMDAGVRYELGKRDERTKALRMVELTGPERLVWDGGEVEFGLSCDGFYEPREVHLWQNGTRLGSDLARLLAPRPGRARIRLAGRPSGDYELRLWLRTTGPEDREEEQIVVRKTLVVLQEPLVLRTGSVTESGIASRYLPDLRLRGMFNYTDGPEPVLRQGGHWRLVPHRPELLRGSVLTGSSEAGLVPVSINSTGDKLLPPLNVRIGRNLIYLQLTDVLKRSVTVVGAAGEPQKGRYLIADFYHYAEVARPRSTDPAIQLEAGENARLILDSPYPFTERDDIQLMLGAPRPIRPQVRQADGGGSVLEFLLPYDRLKLASSLDDQDMRQEGQIFQITPNLHTPAGPTQTLDLQVKTIRSALTMRKLAELFDAVPAELADIVMVPVLSPRAEFQDPVGEQFAWRSKFRPQPPINVQNIRDCYLQQGELTRQQYQAIVDKTLPGLVGDAGDADLWRQLVFPADPKGMARLNAAAMLPAVHRGYAAAWQQQLRDGPQRPVTGVNFYQAYTATRLAGWLVARKPDLFRLPLGVEMELAVLGPDPGGARLNGGSAGTGSAAARSVTYADHRRASRQMALAGRWPPTRTENEAMGDRVSGSRGTLLGLDFGVREWVMDLPWLEHPAGGMIRSLHSDYQRHLQASTMFLTNKYLAHVHQELGALGVVRGLALGEVALLRDALDPQAGNSSGANLSVTVPGVVRTLHVRRDGGGVLPDEPDPHLGKVGLRLCGEAAFVAEARRR